MKKVLKQPVFRFLFHAGIFAVFILLVSRKGGIWYEANDDHVIADLLNGRMTGNQEWRTIYNSVLFSLPVSICYKAFPLVPWYGGILLFYHLLAFVLPVNALTVKNRSVWTYFLKVGFAGLVLGASWYMQAEFQYSSTAGILAAAGYLCLLFYEGKMRYVTFALLEFLAYTLRPESMEIMQPLGMVVWAGIVLGTNADGIKALRKNFKDIARKVLIPAGIAAFIILACSLIDNAAYSSAEWKHALTLNDARTIIWDYNERPDYDEVKPILDKYQLTKTDYDAYCCYLILDYTKMDGALEEIAEYVAAKNDDHPSSLQVLKWVYGLSYKSYLKGVNKLCAFAWVFCFLMSVLSGKWSSFIPTVCYFAFGKIVSWGFVFYRGRMPERVLLPMYLFEIMLALAITLWAARRTEGRKRILGAAAVICLSFLCSAFLDLGIVKGLYQDLMYKKNGYELLRESQYEILQYCSENPENRYIVSQVNYIFWKRHLFDCTCVGGRDNYVYIGGWFAYSPEVKKSVDQYLQGDEKLFLLAESTPILNSREVEDAYLSEMFGNVPAYVGELPLCTGERLSILQVR